MFLILISSMQSHSFADLADWRTAAGRGEFLIPDALLLIESCRRLAREVFPKSKFWRGIKIAIVIVCAIVALLCLGASIVLVTDETANTTKSAIDLTLWCLLIGLVAGTIGVAVPDGEP
jgi:L-asparagine transporter-like permease